MKRTRLLKIMGVALTLLLAFGLVSFLGTVPVVADEDEWSTFDYPEAGEDGDYFRDAGIVDGPSHIARGIDGTFWIYTEFLTTTDELLKSLDTEGRSWEVTDYSADIAGGPITAIVPSAIDEDIVYVADENTVYKTEDGGDSWEDLDAQFKELNEVITCMTLGYGYDDDEPHVYVGTVGDYDVGDVYHIYDVAFGGTWEALELQAPNLAIGADDSAAWGIAASPDFDSDAMVAVMAASILNDKTYVASNEGAAIGDWDDIELLDDLGASFYSNEASDPAFPEDFDIDDNNEYFVGVVGAAHDSGEGGVFRIYDDNYELLDDVDDDIISLDLVGNVGNTYLLAGEYDDPDVWYSDDDGDSWEQASVEGVQPAGDEETYVICDDDIAENDIGWAATEADAPGDSSCLSMTRDGGATWLGISLINSNIDDIDDLAVFASPETVFMVDDVFIPYNVFRYDGTNWERVYQAQQYGGPTIDMVAISPEFDSDETVFLADTAGPTIFYSDNGGDLFEETRNAPGSIVSWTVVDSETVIVGGTANSTVYITDVQGRRAWDDYEVEAGGGNDITSLAVWGDTVICGDNANQVFLSEDFGETWDMVGDALNATAAAATYVGFDTDFGSNNTIYAASDDVVSRFLDITDLDEDWEDFTLEGQPTTISGLVVADGVVYVSDAAVVDSDPDADADTNDQLGAIQRCVNPLEDLDDVDESEFDFMAEGLDADGLVDDEFNLLRVTEGSTTLWAADIDDATIWTIEDLLVGPPVDGIAVAKTDSFTLGWSPFDNATDYEVRVYSDVDMGLAYECYDAVTGDDDAVLIVNDTNATGSVPESATTYWWQARVSDPVHSKWSDVWLFITPPDDLTINANFFAPGLGASGIGIWTPFGWQLIDGADNYVFELFENCDFTKPVVSTTTTNPVFKLDAPLKCGTNYCWRVRAVTGDSMGNWATGSFSTVACDDGSPPPAPPPPGSPTIIVPPTQQMTPTWIYIVIAIGGTLIVIVIIFVVKAGKP
ncbi:MAG: hypothetical protein JSU76_01880 [Dehalococcoidia bacterium]|nr:MAG: hypothetical protein JSU76_01880 [Dehalococcoidia bacterium]